MSSKTTNLSLLMESISQYLGIDINKQLTSKSLKKRTPLSIKKTYNSGNYRANKSQVFTRKLNFENKGHLIINSSLDESSNLAEYTIRLREQDIQNTLFIDQKLRNMIKSSINIVIYQNSLRLKKEIEGFDIDAKINWIQQNDIERSSIKIEISPVYKTVKQHNICIEGPKEIIFKNPLPTINNTATTFFSISDDAFKKLMGDNESSMITLVHDKHDQWNVSSKMFNRLNKRLPEEITVEYAILNDRAEEFIALHEMSTL